MNDIRYKYLRSYLSSAWRLSKYTVGSFPLLSMWVLHITLSRYGDEIFSLTRSPLQESDVRDIKLLTILYRRTVQMEEQVSWALVLLSEVCAVILALLIMLAASHVIHGAVVGGLFLIVLSMTWYMHNPAKKCIESYVRQKTYSRIIYGVIFR